MQPVRQRILEILREQGQATVNQLSQKLEMPAVSVRHHLDVLQVAALVRMTGVQRQGRVGRPQQVYELTEKASAFFPDNYLGLAGGLLSELKRTLPQKQVICLLERVVDRTVSQLEGIPSQPIERRLDAVCHCLSQMGYSADWEPVNGGYIVNTLNCPYAGLAAEHPELCEMDLTMVRKLLSRPAERLLWRPDGDKRCSYVVREEAETAKAA